MFFYGIGTKKNNYDEPAENKILYSLLPIVMLEYGAHGGPFLAVLSFCDIDKESKENRHNLGYKCLSLV